MYQPQLAYFDSEKIQDNIERLEQIADLYFDAGLSEEEAEAAALFDFNAAVKMGHASPITMSHQYH